MLRILYSMVLLASFYDPIFAQEWATNGDHIHNLNAGNVGIGTAEPKESLEIFEPTGSVDLLFNLNNSFGWRLRNHGDTKTFRLAFTTDFASYSPLFTIKPNGNVGFGTLDPRESLEIRKDDGAADVLLNVNNNFGWRLRNHKDTKSFRIAFTRDFASYSPLFTINPNGNVGLGTLDPRESLEIRRDDGAADVLLNVNNNFGWRLRNHKDTKSFRIAFTRDFANYDNILTITNEGKMGVGVLDPNAKLDVNGKTHTNLLEVEGRTSTKVLEITGGSDLAEPFAISGAQLIKPGMIVSIDPAHPGQLRIASEAYDRTVAGIVSGANGLNPGLIMKQKGTVANGTFPVALTGRVYCWADTSNGPIQPGDLLTTSGTPGYAMKITDYAKAQGTIIGKAMSSLTQGKGLVLVLVTLQ